MTGGVLVIIDHASNHVPAEIELGIDPALLETHIAWDIGAVALGRTLGFPVIAGTVSRLVIDLNREEDSPGIVPPSSDGVVISGNPGNVADRIGRYWRPYHKYISCRIEAIKPKMLVSLHSFTPNLSSRPLERRPWEIGILYNQDNRAARIAIPLLEAAGIITGDQLPYSGKTLNATMNRHGESTGTPYLGIEVRQNLISDDAGVARWAAILRPVIQSCLDQFVARGRESA
jgi:predicted N-formylglutamate amidohydrolase